MRLSYFVSVSALVLGSGAASAGGIISPVMDVSPVVVTTEAPIAAAWGGAYVGGSLGYIFDTDDQVGFSEVIDGDDVGLVGGLGDVGISGATAGLQLGYRWQRGNWVFGPELGVEFGSVDESIDFGDDVDATSGSVESEMKNIATLVMKTGYAVNPQTLVYGTFGVARGDFDYTVSTDDGSLTRGFDATGAAAGLGVERMINARTSVFAEYQYRDFGNERIEFTDGIDTVSTRASMTMSTVKVGANFRF
ncbi:outer membrane protein [Paracoccus sp. Ld10]|uniref:outer membrane protein n=1 Tax=Paracoccus sp. Ld10 TaxID=649158 RepID=UPI00386E85AD